VGASGDLAPLAHIAYAMMGEGEVMVGGTGNGERGTASGLDGSPFPVSRSPARDALLSAGLEPIDFQAKEGIAFINGTQVQTATLAVAVHDARVVWRSAVGAAAMTLEALMGTPTPFDERIHAVRPHPGQVEAARLLRKLLADSRIRDSHRDGDPRVQDAYSLRCTPQILGAVHDAIAFARHTAEIEINASTDNPLLFGDELLSGGNFHGQPIALALDVLAIALATLAGLAERRLERVVNPDLSHGLPPFLSRDAGVGSGLMMLQVTAAALAGECRTLAAPASVHSIPTDANQEDVVPMGMTAAWKARRVLANATRVVACELIAGAQGLEFRKPLEPGRGVRALYARVRELVPALDRDRPLSPDMERVADAVAREMFL
jgi:histidine ammonia-lyase